MNRVVSTWRLLVLIALCRCSFPGDDLATPPTQKAIHWASTNGMIRVFLVQRIAVAFVMLDLTNKAS